MICCLERNFINIMVSRVEYDIYIYIDTYSYSLLIALKRGF